VTGNYVQGFEERDLTWLKVEDLTSARDDRSWFNLGLFPDRPIV
jgi:hypothetical protein